MAYDIRFTVLHATGVHTGCLKSLSLLIQVAKFDAIGLPFFSFSLQSIRTSILAFYLRLSVDPTFRKIVWFTIAATWIIAIILFFLAELQCMPPSAQWDPEVIFHNAYDDYCLNRWAIAWAWCVCSIISDCWVLILPIKMLLGLRVGRKQKAIVLLVFGLGFLACVASIVRIPATRILNTSPDPLWDAYIVGVTSTVEWTLAIMAASAPALKPLVTKVFPRLETFTSRGTRASRTDPSTLETGTTKFTNSYVAESDVRNDGEQQANGRINEMGLAPQMPPGRQFGWRRILNFFRGREKIIGENPGEIPAAEVSQKSTANVGFWGARRRTLDMTNNDFCVDTNHTHELPPPPTRASRKDSIFA
ncbi:hypothetical protein TWF694_003228 [Orbilia ellipsospora]|uniref:Rhodopsin domain-containing protein n=1 Tax=Orbilia ellipsospora TaxID=2528407 RepID=A0AAV9X273_9PEZI